MENKETEDRMALGENDTENVEQLQNEIDILEKAIGKFNDRLGDMTNQKSELGEKKLDLQQEMDELRKKEKDNKEEIENSSANNKDRDTMDKIKELIASNEEIKRSEGEFRVRCKEKLEEIQDRNGKMQEKLDRSCSKTENKEEEEQAKEKLKTLRLKLAKRTRVINSLERKIDSVPSRAELSQYQRRFLELYNQVIDSEKPNQMTTEISCHAMA